jgi:hypothetical protein
MTSVLRQSGCPELYWYVLVTETVLPPCQYGYSTPVTTKGTSAVKFSTSNVPLPAGKALNTYGGTVKAPALCGTKHWNVALMPGVELTDCPMIWM